MRNRTLKELVSDIQDEITELHHLLTDDPTVRDRLPGLFEKADYIRLKLYYTAKEIKQVAKMLD